MKLLCKLFGHKPEAYSSRKPYFDVYPSGRDGIGREHASLFANCDRCKERFHVGYIHLPQGEIKCPMA